MYLICKPGQVCLEDHVGVTRFTCFPLFILVDTPPACVLFSVYCALSYFVLHIVLDYIVYKYSCLHISL